MKRTMVAAVMALWVGSWVAPAAADTLTMHNGTRVQGELVSFDARTVVFRRTDGETRRYRASEVDTVSFTSASDDRISARAGSPQYDGARTDRVRADRSRPAIDIPAGTELIVRTVEMIDSRNAGPDQTFAALVERSVPSFGGGVLVPEGASAQLVIRDMSRGGGAGGAEMVLDVQSLTLDGLRYSVSTTDLVVESDTGLGSNKRTAEVVGGGAVLGTVIGAVVGGGKGAAIGGLIGAAGGAGAQVLTQGHDVRVPAETVLKFRLDRAVTLRSERDR